jgi:hypothetical protein
MSKSTEIIKELIIFEDDKYKLIRKDVPEEKEGIAHALAPYDILEIAMDGIYSGISGFVEPERSGLMKPLIERWEKLRKAIKV